MITVHFHGLLKQYGDSVQLAVENPAEAMIAICMQIPGFEETIMAGNWHVLRGAIEDQDSADEESLTLSFGQATEMHLIPAIEGANGGVLSIIVGVALIAFSFGNPMMIAAGVGLLVGGIVMMTMRLPSTNTDTESTDQKASFLFGKPTNSSTQGVAIPRGYGRMRVGSVVVSTSVVAEQLLEGNEGIA